MTVDEELTLTLENLIMLTWLRLVHPKLHKLIKYRYGTELCSHTLASIKPEISQALYSLFNEINAANQTKIMQLPPCYTAKAREIVGILEDDYEDSTIEYPHTSTKEEDLHPKTASAAFHVETRQSPYMDMFHGHTPVRITIDNSVTPNMICLSLIREFHAHIESTSQSTHQADGSSPLKVVGEICLSFAHRQHNFAFEGLVVENLDIDILAGTPFMKLMTSPCGLQKGTSYLETVQPLSTAHPLTHLRQPLHNVQWSYVVPQALQVCGLESSWKSTYPVTQ